MWRIINRMWQGASFQDALPMFDKMSARGHTGRLSSLPGFARLLIWAGVARKKRWHAEVRGVWYLPGCEPRCPVCFTVKEAKQPIQRREAPFKPHSRRVPASLSAPFMQPVQTQSTVGPYLFYCRYCWFVCCHCFALFSKGIKVIDGERPRRSPSLEKKAEKNSRT